MARVNRDGVGDVGDLTWNKSYRLFCPNNMVGRVDAYVMHRFL